MPDVPAAAPAAPHTVFVSHAHADNALCDHFVEALRQRGLDVWYDRTNMQDGHFLSEQISTELEQRTAFVVLLTPASVASFWVRLEMQAYLNLVARDPTRLFLAVRIVDCTVPTLLQAFKWIDAVSLGFDATIDALAKALRAPATPPRTAAPPPPAESVDDLLKRGQMLSSQGKYAEALALLEQALALDRFNVEAWVAKGWALNSLGREAQALMAFERVVQAYDPTNANAWMGKSIVLSILGSDVEADTAYQRARELGWKEEEE